MESARVDSLVMNRGRAIVFPRDQLRVKSSLRDRYEELEQWAPFAYPGAVGSWIATAHSVTTWEALHDLCGVVVSGRECHGMLNALPAEYGLVTGEHRDRHVHRLQASGSGNGSSGTT